MLLPMIVGLGLGGCTAPPTNPSFPLTVAESREAIAEMKEDPRPLERPVVVVGGYLDPGIAAQRVGEKLAKMTTNPENIAAVTFFSNATFETSRERLIREVMTEFPSDDPEWTTEVDIIAISMGGLVTRYAMLENGDGLPRLRVARMFGIAVPHKGARLAELPTTDQRQKDMRKGSDFLEFLNGTQDYEPYVLYSYARLGDTIVGIENVTLDGESVWWVPNKPFEGAHLQAQHDPRFLADIARRLRGEDPFATDPPAPLPEEEPEGSTRQASLD